MRVITIRKENIFAYLLTFIIVATLFNGSNASTATETTSMPSARKVVLIDAGHDEIFKTITI